MHLFVAIAVVVVVPFDFIRFDESLIFTASDAYVYLYFEIPSNNLQYSAAIESAMYYIGYLRLCMNPSLTTIFKQKQKKEQKYNNQ